MTSEIIGLLGHLAMQNGFQLDNKASIDFLRTQTRGCLSTSVVDSRRAVSKRTGTCEHTGVIQYTRN